MGVKVVSKFPPFPLHISPPPPTHTPFLSVALVVSGIHSVDLAGLDQPACTFPAIRSWGFFVNWRPA